VIPQARPEDDAGLADKVAIIAGGGAAGDGIGNGRAAAILLARAGTKVLVIDRDLALAERTVAMIAANGGTAVAHAADLTDEKQANGTVSAALDRFGRLDFLDNNVGIASRGTVVDEKPESWRRIPNSTSSHPFQVDAGLDFFGKLMKSLRAFSRAAPISIELLAISSINPRIWFAVFSRSVIGAGGCTQARVSPMPAEKPLSPRQEAFAQAIAHGKPQIRAYALAG
jgi:NAD(P)-dependent dehydrogenase (short-subunit alcohol dehydrogenase family)